MKRRNEEISKIGGDDDPYFCPEELSIQNSPEVSITKAGDDGQGVKKLKVTEVSKNDENEFFNRNRKEYLGNPIFYLLSFRQEHSLLKTGTIVVQCISSQSYYSYANPEKLIRLTVIRMNLKAVKFDFSVTSDNKVTKVIIRFAKMFKKTIIFSSDFEFYEKFPELIIRYRKLVP